MNLKEEFKKMQLRLTWLVLVLFAVGIMSIGIVGCGTDEEEAPEKPTESTSTEPAEEPVVASRPPIDFDAEKEAIQALYTEFYNAFNDFDIKAVGETFDTSTIAFGTIFAGNEPVPVATGWNDVKTNILGLWNGIGTKGNKWGQNDRLTDFWIRYKGSKLEAAAIGYNCYKGSFPGETHLYLIKIARGGKFMSLIAAPRTTLASSAFTKANRELKNSSRLPEKRKKSNDVPRILLKTALFVQLRESAAPFCAA